MTPLLYLALFAAGAAIGGQLNRGIYRLAWYPRPIGPWSAPHPQAPPRRPSDRLPILGWWGLRRESPIHGRGYWIRPLAIEAATGAGLAALYWWEVAQAGLIPAAVPAPDAWTLHAPYVAHALLICLMLVATFIDFDEKTIPDAITLPGTLAGLTLMACWPAAALPVGVPGGMRGLALGPLLLSSPQPWPHWLNGPWGLGLGIACLAGWCLAIWPKTVTARRGWIRGARYLMVSMFRYPGWQLIAAILISGAAAIALVWWLGGPRWSSLLSALTGMAFGGGLIWAVRIVGGGALGKEAMGFGDVTLMAMIGVYVGWQSALLIFFMAPFVAVLICLAQWLLTRRRDIAFGPYLCAATLILIVGWNDIWQHRAGPIFSLGWLIPQVLFLCLILMGGLLGLWRITEQAIFGRPR